MCSKPYHSAGTHPESPSVDGVIRDTPRTDDHGTTHGGGRRQRADIAHVDAREFRRVRGWSQSDLAVALEWSRQKVQRYEAGEDVPLTDEDRVRLHRLRLLAERVSA